jgi:hypothetical protein
MGKPTLAEQFQLAATHCPDLLSRLVELEAKHSTGLTQEYTSKERRRGFNYSDEELARIRAEVATSALLSLAEDLEKVVRFKGRRQ